MGSAERVALFRAESSRAKPCQIAACVGIQHIGTLDGKSLDLVTEGLDLASELGGFVGGDAGGDDRAADTTGATKEGLAGDVDVRNALVL